MFNQGQSGCKEDAEFMAMNKNAVERKIVDKKFEFI